MQTEELPEPPTGIPTPPGEVEPEEVDDRPDVTPNREPDVEGDPHGSPLDDPEDEKHLRDLREPEDPAA
jgi:hypothetical protein